MKRIEDIEMMEWDQLESAADAENIAVPDTLVSGIKARLAAEAAARRAPARWVPYTALAVAAGLAALAILPSGSRSLKDTYDDPYLAYAQVESTFRQISDKMAFGVELAAKAGETAEMPARIIQTISE